MSIQDVRKLYDMTDNEMVAFWNVLMFQRRAGLPVGDKVRAVKDQLRTRGVPFKVGKLIV